MLKYMFTTLLVASSFFSFAQSHDEDGVKSVLRQYLRAVEKLDAAGSDTLFTDDSQLFANEPFTIEMANNIIDAQMMEISQLQDWLVSNKDY